MNKELYELALLLRGMCQDGYFGYVTFTVFSDPHKDMASFILERAGLEYEIRTDGESLWCLSVNREVIHDVNTYEDVNNYISNFL